MKYIDMGAVISADEKYRYVLWRTWERAKPVVVWWMLNPSTADAKKDDATIRKCVGFAERWGCGGIRVVNLFALRSRNPRALIEAAVEVDHVVGPENLRWVQDVTGATFHTIAGSSVVCAWGRWASHPRLRGMAAHVRDSVAPARPCYTLGLTKCGQPVHPLMIAYETPRQAFAL